jgi:hypothetical protein
MHDMVRNVLCVLKGASELWRDPSLDVPAPGDQDRESGGLSHLSDRAANCTGNGHVVSARRQSDSVTQQRPFGPAHIKRVSDIQKPHRYRTDPGSATASVVISVDAPRWLR